MSEDSLEIIKGTVTRYAGNGRKLGYPTANISTDTTLSDGVYFGFARLGEYSHNAALIFIGTPTTVGDIVRRIEAHLLDIPDQDYYGLELRLNVKRFHRKSETFNSLDELIVAMKDDEAAARQWLKVQN